MHPGYYFLEVSSQVRDLISEVWTQKSGRRQDSIKSGSVITKNGALTIGLASLKHSVSVRKLGAVIELTPRGGRRIR